MFLAHQRYVWILYVSLMSTNSYICERFSEDFYWSTETAEWHYKWWWVFVWLFSVQFHKSKLPAALIGFSCWISSVLLGSVELCK